MRFVFIFFALIVAGCSSQDPMQLSNRPPGVDVARAALSSGSAAVALNVTTALLATRPRDVPALLVQGEALVSLGREAEAEANFSKALEIEPGSIDGRMDLGRLRIHTAPALAQIIFLSVVHDEPRTKGAFNNLGIVYDIQGNHAAAQVAYRHALDIDPSMLAAEVNLALSMALTGQAADAVSILRPLASRPGAVSLIRQNLALALTLSGGRLEAAQILGETMPPDQVQRTLQAYGALGR